MPTINKFLDRLDFGKLPPGAKDCYDAIRNTAEAAALMGGVMAMATKDNSGEALKKFQAMVEELRQHPVFIPTTLMHQTLLYGSVLELWEARFNQLDPESARGMATALKDLARAARGLLPK